MLKITWLQNANQGAGSTYDNGTNATDGRMTWDNAKAWAENLVFGGFDDWRLPTVTPYSGDTISDTFRNNGTSDVGFGYTIPNSELRHMYYANLGNLGFCTPNNADPAGCVEQKDVDNIPIWGLKNTGPFTNLQSNIYWSGTDASYLCTGCNLAMLFSNESGGQSYDWKTKEFHAWAVRDGDVAPPVPLPAAAWLLLSGLGGLAALGRRRAGRTG